MYIELHDETANGTVFYRPVYDLGEINELIPYSINAPADLSTKHLGYFDNSNPSVVQNFAETYDLPLNDEADGNILTDSIFPVPGVGQYEYKCYNEDPSAFEKMTVGTKPDDFDTNPHYCWYTNWRAADGNIYYCQVPAAKIPWNANAQYWYDKHHKISKRIYAGPISFYISKLIDCDIGYYNNTRAWIQWGANVEQTIGGGYQNTASFTDNPAAHNCLTYNDDPIKYGNYNEYIFDRTNMPSSSGGLTMNGNLCCSCFFVKCSRNGVDYVGIGILQKTYDYFGGAFTRLSLRVIEADIFGDIVHDGDPPEPQPDDNFGPNNETSGANGTFYHDPTLRDSSDPGLTPMNIIAGINVNLDDLIFGSNDLTNDAKYCLQTFDNSNFQHFIEVLYSDDFIKKYTNAYYNPMSSIPVAHLLPEAFVNMRLNNGGGGNKNKVNVSAAGLTFTYDVGGVKTNVKSTKIYPFATLRSEVLDLSSLVFGAFPDFDGYTKMTIHIPFIGEVPIDVNKCMGGRIQITLNCDCQTGNLAAWIWTEDKDGNCDYYQIATGNCSYPLPVASMTSDGINSIGKIVSGFLTVVGGAAAIAGSGGAALPVIAGAGAIAGGAATAVQGDMQRKYQRSSEVRFNNSGALSVMTDPELWIDITRPVWVEPENYRALHGIPSYTGKSIVECPVPGFDPLNPQYRPFNGYLEVEKIEMSNITGMTEEEKTMVEDILRSGVYIDGSTINEE